VATECRRSPPYVGVSSWRRPSRLPAGLSDFTISRGAVSVAAVDELPLAFPPLYTRANGLLQVSIAYMVALTLDALGASTADIARTLML
jgi:hypothetical protein